MRTALVRRKEIGSDPGRRASWTRLRISPVIEPADTIHHSRFAALHIASPSDTVVRAIQARVTARTAVRSHSRARVIFIGYRDAILAGLSCRLRTRCCGGRRHRSCRCQGHLYVASRCIYDICSHNVDVHDGSPCLVFKSRKRVRLPSTRPVQDMLFGSSPHEREP
jgi:hypothetical protein